MFIFGRTVPLRLNLKAFLMYIFLWLHVQNTLAVCAYQTDIMSCYVYLDVFAFIFVKPHQNLFGRGLKKTKRSVCLTQSSRFNQTKPVKCEHILK